MYCWFGDLITCLLFAILGSTFRCMRRNWSWLEKNVKLLIARFFPIRMPFQNLAAIFENNRYQVWWRRDTILTVRIFDAAHSTHRELCACTPQTLWGKALQWINQCSRKTAHLNCRKNIVQGSKWIFDIHVNIKHFILALPAWQFLPKSLVALTYDHCGISPITHSFEHNLSSVFCDMKIQLVNWCPCYVLDTAWSYQSMIYRRLMLWKHKKRSGWVGHFQLLLSRISSDPVM